MSFNDWSPVAANNATKPGINWAEGMQPSDVNNSARQMMADLALTGVWGFRPTAYLAVGDQVADDTTYVNNTFAAAAAAGAQAKVVLNGNFLVTGVTNPYGIQTEGYGNIVQNITGGVQQLNTYADPPGRIVYGKEYLTRVYQRAAIGQSGASGRIGCFMYGDSTVANGYMTQSTVSVMTRLFQMRGISNISITNRGVAGTQISDLNALPDVSATTDLMIIKYGINDGTNPENTRLATFQSTLEAKISAIRAAANGSVGGLAIVLVGPNATGDTPNGRDERWYEQLRGIYVNIARKYKCCYIDTYAAFRDPRGGAGIWLDNAFGDGRGIHPLDSLGYQIWSLVADTIFTRDEVSFIGSNQFINASSQTYAPVGGVAPSLYGLGNWHGRAQLASGWPIDGFVIHQRNPDQGTLQILYPFSQNNTRMMIRTANTGSDAFNRWSGVAENLTLLNGWLTYGSTFETASAFVDVSGVVHLQGMIKSGTTTVGTQFGTLPAGMAPAKDKLFLVTGAATNVVIKVAGTTGALTFQTAGDAGYTSLEGISFLAA